MIYFHIRGCATHRASGDRIIFFLVEFFPRDFAFGYAGKFDQKINDLFLENRRPQSGNRLWILAVIVPNALLLARKLPGTLHHGAA